MIITYHGDNYVKLQSGKQQVLIDPTDQRSFKGASLVLLTERSNEINGHNGNHENLFLIDHQGEYEVQKIKIRGYQNEWSSSSADTKEKNDETEKTVFIIEFDGFKFLILGKTKEEPKTEIHELAKEIDVAIVPGGGKPYLSEATVARFLRQIEPAMIVPTLWGKNIDGLLKELNKENRAPEEKLVIQKKDVREGTMEMKFLSKK